MIEPAPSEPSRTSTAQVVTHADGAEAREWEMVLPKMVRRRTGRLGANPGLLGEGQSPVNTLLGVVRRWPRIPAVGAAILLTGVVLWNVSETAQGHAGDSIELVSKQWISEPTLRPSNSRQARLLTLYRPSMGQRDYRMSFEANVDRNAVGWVFRAADSRNYYAMKLELVHERANFSVLALTHFRVVGGRESAHIERRLPVTNATDGACRVRLDVSGPLFTVYVQDQLSEVWRDDSLKAGGIGFFSEGSRQPDIGAVRLSLPPAVPGV